MLPDPTAADARTVAHLAIYLAELKDRAARLPDEVHASRRGYFTPSEDERVRQMLVSYCQTRAALLEIITAFRENGEPSASAPGAAPAPGIDSRPAAFLVAYAAAVLLVDAARFLRETFDASPTVVKKLNEPEPNFGIPAGTYDTVQASLTSLRNAWHLLNAMYFFSAHRDELAKLAAGEPGLAPVFDVIERLGHRLFVSVSQHAEARWRVRARMALEAVRRDVFGQLLYNLQQWGGCAVSEVHTKAGHAPALPAAVSGALRTILRPGDAIVVRKEHALTNYFLPGYWPHAALYLGEPSALEKMGIHEHENVKPRWSRLLSPGGEGSDSEGSETSGGEPRRVLEAMKDGVRIRTVRSPLASDAIAVIRPLLPPREIASALARGMFHEGKPYDFDFDFTRSDRLVCTEVVYRSYEGIGGVRFELTRRAGRLTLAAEDLLGMALRRTHFEPVAVYAPGYTEALTTGAACDEALRETMALAPSFTG